jgi:hypothetical protein
MPFDFTPGQGGVGASDEIGGVHYPQFKLGKGPTGEYTEVSDDSPLPVKDTDLNLVLGTKDDLPEPDTTVAASFIAVAKSILDQLKEIVSIEQARDLDESPASIEVDETGNYEFVAATAADQVVGATGALGDHLRGILIIPATTSPGAVSIKDGSAGTSRTIFVGGTVPSVWPVYVPIGADSVAAGGWRVTTGASVSCYVFGEFT